MSAHKTEHNSSEHVVARPVYLPVVICPLHKDHLSPQGQFLSMSVTLAKYMGAYINI